MTQLTLSIGASETTKQLKITKITFETDYSNIKHLHTAEYNTKHTMRIVFTFKILFHKDFCHS